VIFDLDGTLIESEQIWGDVRHEFAVTNGGHWRENAQSDMIGMRTQEWANYIHDQLGVALCPQQIAESVVAMMIDRLSRNVPVLPGADEALNRLSQTFPLGLATSATSAVAQAVLEKTGWRSLFQVVVSADEVARGKPAPDVYLRALDLLNADPRKTAAIEDSANGIRSAHAAALTVIAVPNPAFPPDQQTLALATHILPNLEPLNTSLIISLLNDQGLSH
jgi:HAD superfamily hydrolase (TIGR01509 family)